MKRSPKRSPKRSRKRSAKRRRNSNIKVIHVRISPDRRYRSPKREGGSSINRQRGDSLNRECVSQKIGILRKEGYPQRQAVAIAYKMCEADSKSTK